MDDINCTSSRSNLGDAGNQRAELARSCLPFHVGTARFSTSKKVLPAGCPSQHHKLVLRSCFDEQVHIQLIKLQVLVVGSSCILCWESRQVYREPNLEIEWSWWWFKYWERAEVWCCVQKTQLVGGRFQNLDW